MKETPNEKKLRERKFSLNRLLDKVSLEPVALSAISSDKKGKGKAAKRNLFEDYDGMMVKRKDAGGEDEEEEEMDVNQLNQICECSFRALVIDDKFLLLCDARLEGSQKRRLFTRDGSTSFLQILATRMYATLFFFSCPT